MKICTKVFIVLSVMLAPYAVAEQGDAKHSINCTTQSVTVFQDVSAMNRRKGAGRNLTELHQKYEAMGYDFADLEIYIEDGDLEGFFVTYTVTTCEPAQQVTENS